MNKFAPLVLAFLVFIAAIQVWSSRGGDRVGTDSGIVSEADLLDTTTSVATERTFVTLAPLPSTDAPPVTRARTPVTTANVPANTGDDPAGPSTAATEGPGPTTEPTDAPPPTEDPGPTDPPPTEDPGPTDPPDTDPPGTEEPPPTTEAPPPTTESPNPTIGPIPTVTIGLPVLPLDPLDGRGRRP